MSDFDGNEDLLRDFLIEANELLADLDNRLIALEKSPHDRALLNAAFRSFHTIKGGASFLSAGSLVVLCHRTENLLDLLRNGKLSLDTALMDVILDATAAVRAMLDALSAARQPQSAPAALLAALEQLTAADSHGHASTSTPREPAGAAFSQHPVGEPDWQSLLASVAGHGVQKQRREDDEISGTGTAPIERSSGHPAHGRRATDNPQGLAARSGRRESDPLLPARDATIRIDTARIDHVLNVAGEIGLAKNRLLGLRSELMSGRCGPQNLHALDEALGQLDLLVGELQGAVMRTRMQPVRRLFQKYPRLVRDLARELAKDVELLLEGEDTELDRTMLEELSDPLLHLVRNALDHGMESPAERRAAGKPEKGTIKLCARHSGDHIVIEIADDGRGMRPEALRRKAIEKNLADPETVRGMDDRQALGLIFLPGFSTKDEVTRVSGRGVGMDVVKSNVQKLNGRIELSSVPGSGTTVSVSLPLTLAILPVLVVRSGDQPFAIPLTMVREIVRLLPERIDSVSGKATLLLRDEVLPLRSLAALLGRESADAPAYGVLLQTSAADIVLAVEGLAGRDDVVIKPLDGIKPKGIAGATLAADGSVILVLDVETLLIDAPIPTRASLLARAA